MSLLTKLFTLLRGGANEAGQSVVDANALRILDQEIRDAGNELTKSKQELTKVMAQRQLLAGKNNDRAAKKAEYEGYIAGALRKGDEGLAREVAERLATLENDISTDGKTLVTYDQSIVALKTAISETERKLSRVKQQVDTVKATEAVQRAQGAVASRHSGANGKVGTALDSLERIQARQLERGARMEAAAQLESESNGGDLDARLATAGLLPQSASVDNILERFRDKPVQQLSHEPVPQQALPSSIPDAEREPRQ